MSKYDNYGHFMIAVLNEADRKCIGRHYGSLAGLFRLNDSNRNLIDIITKIFDVGWPAFVAVCGLLVLGPIAFVAALAAFIAGGIGLVVVAALAVYGGTKAIMLLYGNKATPLAIYHVGLNYKARFDAHKNEYAYIDSLISEASDEIIRNA